MKRLLVFLLAQLLALPAVATVTYSYTGDPMAAFWHTGYDSRMRVTGWFTVATALPANLSFANIAPQVLAYRFADGVNVIASTDSHAVIHGFRVGTDAAGNIKPTATSIDVQRWETMAGVNQQFDRIKIDSYNGGFSSGLSNANCGLIGSPPTSCSGWNGASAFWGETATDPGVPTPGVWSVTARPRGVSYFDLWWNPAEPGWGVQIAQSGTFQFVTFFVYDSDGRPTWYTAELTADGTGNYIGTLYANTGSYFGLPWVPGLVTNVAVGTASFQPDTPYQATLVYTLTGGPSVSKAIERQPLLPRKLAGSYSGAIAGSVTGCDNAAYNHPVVRGHFDLVVAQSGDASATLAFTITDGGYAGMSCMLSGPLTHLGSLYRIGNAQYTCTGTGFSPGATTAVIERLHPTDQGIEGLFTTTVAGCNQTINFGGVMN
jgi:hypothetical protein